MRTIEVGGYEAIIGLTPRELGLLAQVLGEAVDNDRWSAKRDETTRDLALALSGGLRAAQIAALGGWCGADEVELAQALHELDAAMTVPA
ncbi:MAG: hypothetical protein GX601_08230 [Anaerolineales bacterium]|nr:hypothetical protein [Anaerolineales bacterium]